MQQHSQKGFTRTPIVALRFFANRFSLVIIGTVQKIIGKQNNIVKRKNMPLLVSGFTFIELVVVISIVSIISSVLIFNYGSFDANIRLQNLAQDIALRIKEAQTVAISGTFGHDYSYEFQSDPLGQAPSYGVYFDFDQNAPILAGIDPDKIFAFFADRPVVSSSLADHAYDLGPIDGIITPHTANPSRGSLCDNAGQSYEECLAVTQITSLDRISGIYYNDAGVINTISTLGITFTRPLPAAHFATADMGALSAQEVYIELQSQRDTRKHKYVTVNQTGQISVSDGCAPGHDSNDPLCLPL